MMGTISSNFIAEGLFGLSSTFSSKALVSGGIVTNFHTIKCALIHSHIHEMSIVHIWKGNLVAGRL